MDCRGVQVRAMLLLKLPVGVTRRANFAVLPVATVWVAVGPPSTVRMKDGVEIPVPLRGRARGEFGSELAIWREPGLTPVAEGVNVT
jgi:hypothetical protein